MKTSKGKGWAILNNEREIMNGTYLDYYELIEDIREPQDGCAYMEMGGGLYLVLAWCDSADYGDGDFMGTVDDTRYTLMGKLAYNCDDLQCDYNWDWNMPTSRGEIVDTEMSIVQSKQAWDGWKEIAQDILDGLKDGTIDRWEK